MTISQKVNGRISVAQPVFNGKEKEYVMQCMDSGWISSSGAFINEFEKKFAEYCKVKHAIACTNGTVALHLALVAKGIGPGDEILVPSLTYIASANAVRYCGAVPVFVECDPKTWNIDPKKIAERITPKTKGIIPVHLFGLPVDMDEILAITKKNGLFILEDAAEALGATYKNKSVGTMGDIGTFSFFGNKIITTGEGGMVITNDDILANKMRILRNQGMSPERRYWHPIVGYNYRMTNIQAAIGLAQLENIQWHLEQRKKVANQYGKLLEDFQDRIQLPSRSNDSSHCFWMYSIVLKQDYGMSRDALMSKLEADGIETRPIFYTITDMPPYLEKPGSYPVTDAISANGISLPTHAALTPEDIQFIVGRIKHHSSR